MRLRRSGLERRPRRCAPEDRCRRRAPGQSRSRGAAGLARSRPSRGSEGARVLRERSRPRIQSRSWRSAARASGKRGCPGRRGARIEPEISLTGGKNAVLRVGRAKRLIHSAARKAPSGAEFRGLARRGLQSADLSGYFNALAFWAARKSPCRSVSYSNVKALLTQLLTNSVKNSENLRQPSTLLKRPKKLLG